MHDDAITVLLEKLRTERSERNVLEEKLAEIPLLRAEIAELRQRAGIVLTEKTFADALSDFEAWGCRCGGRGGRPWSPVHERQMKNRMAWWVGKLKSCPLAEIKLSDVQVALATIQGAPKTKHDYAMTLTTFLNWCRKNDLLGFDPLKHLGKLDKQAVEDWRALTIVEVKSLLAAAPADRRIIYALSATTGLRIGEIGALKVKHLDMINGCLRPATDDMKNRKKTVLPVPKSVMDGLIDLTKGKAREALLLPIHHNYGKDFTVDLEAAGIVYETPEGKAVVHSLRKSFTTLVQELSGASLSEAQKLSRHSTPALTSNTYTKTGGKRLSLLVDDLGSRLLA